MEFLLLIIGLQLFHVYQNNLIMATLAELKAEVAGLKE